jgi:hypothetical protein
MESFEIEIDAYPGAGQKIRHLQVSKNIADEFNW